jgi:hypothetical protein
MQSSRRNLMMMKASAQDQEADEMKDYVLPIVKKEFNYDISHLHEDDFDRPEGETEALKYHAYPIPGKYTIVPSKVMATAQDLTLAYSPGVAEPCLKI